MNDVSTREQAFTVDTSSVVSPTSICAWCDRRRSGGGWRAQCRWALICSLAVAVSVWLATEEEVDELLDDTLRASAEVMAALLPASGLPSGVPCDQRRHALRVAGGRSHPARGDAIFACTERAVCARAADGATSTTSGGASLAWRSARGRILYVCATAAERAEAKFEVAVSAVLAALAVGILGYFWLSALLPA